MPENNNDGVNFNVHGFIENGSFDDEAPKKHKKENSKGFSFGINMDGMDMKDLEKMLKDLGVSDSDQKDIEGNLSNLLNDLTENLRNIDKNMQDFASGEKNPLAKAMEDLDWNDLANSLYKSLGIPSSLLSNNSVDSVDADIEYTLDDEPEIQKEIKELLKDPDNYDSDGLGQAVVNSFMESFGDDCDDDQDIADAVEEFCTDVKDAHHSNNDYDFDGAKSYFEEILTDLANQMFGFGEDEEESCKNNCSSCGNCKNHSEKKKEPRQYTLSDSKYFKPEMFGSILCLKNKNLYKEFSELYPDPIDALDVNKGIRNYNFTELTQKLPLNEIGSMRLIDSTDTFILYFAEPQTPGDVGFFMAFYQNEDGKFTAYIPEFFNTFYVDENNNVGLFNADADSQYFKPAYVQSLSASSTVDFLEFLPLNEDAVKSSVMAALVPKKSNCICTVDKFGTVRHIRVSPHGDSNKLMVGYIKSNGSSAAELLKKDAGITVDDDIPFYFVFPTTLSREDLNIISENIYKSDFSHFLLFSNKELKYNQDGDLYIEVDII